MIAGNGYAYLVYKYTTESGTYSPTTANCNNYLNSTDHNEVHERLLRVGTDGSSMQIPVGDWTEDSTSTISGDPPNANPYESIVTQAGSIPNRVEPILITNSDQGVLLSLNADVPGYVAYEDTLNNWVCQDNTPYCAYQATDLSLSVVQGPPTVRLITATGGSVTSNVTLPRQIIYVEPNLQAQDGTFFGTVDYDWDASDDFLASFDNSGNIKWSKPGYYAQIATSDGGVIGGSVPSCRPVSVLAHTFCRASNGD